MKKLWTLLCVIFTSFTLTACGGASSDSSAVMATTAAAMAPGAAKYESVTVAETFAYAEEAVENSLDSGSGLNTSSGVNPVVDIGRKLIRTVHLDVETDDFDTLLSKLQEQITAIAGYVEQSDISGNSIQSERSRRRAYMTIRVPSSKLDQFITSVEENGNVTNKSETTTDVTLQYSDLESKKKSLTIEQDRIWALLEKADTLEAVIALEERLSEIRYELESMESKLRLYDNQVEYSTVYVNVSEVKVYTPTAPETVTERIQKGFTRNLENMKEASVDFIVWAISSTPMLIPLLLVVLLVVLVIRRKASKKTIKNITSGFSVKLDSDSADHNHSNK